MYNKQLKYDIDAVARCFLIQKRILKENELGICTKSSSEIEYAKKLTSRIYLIIDDLDAESKYIIHNEVVLGKKGGWYYGFISTPTYYRHRRKAYKEFLEFLEQ